MRRLGDLAPTTLALMHGASYQGDGKSALYQLATAYEDQYFTENCITSSLFVGGHEASAVCCGFGLRNRRGVVGLDA